MAQNSYTMYTNGLPAEYVLSALTWACSLWASGVYIRQTSDNTITLAKLITFLSDRVKKLTILFVLSM